jgi:predicted RNase H-like HicB family nuclease
MVACPQKPIQRTFHAIVTSTGTHGESAVKFTITVDRDESGAWVAECPAIPGCVSQGVTRDEALANVREAIQSCLEVRAERGMPLTVETTQVEVLV